MHFTGPGVVASAALFVYLASLCQRAAENDFAADDGSVSGDGRSFRCCTVGELLRDCVCVYAMAVTLVCDEKGLVSIPNPRRSDRSAFTIFNVRTEQKQIEKLRYIHRNPVKRGLTEKPKQWAWSSFRSYLFGETGLVRVKSQEWPMEIKARPVAKFGDGRVMSHPLIRKERE